MFEAYITNTALYPLMGIEVGTTVHFPMTTQELQAALAKIGIDGKRYSEVFFGGVYHFQQGGEVHFLCRGLVPDVADQSRVEQPFRLHPKIFC